MQALIDVIMRHYRYQGKVFVYLIITEEDYSEFYTDTELETLLQDHTLHVNQLHIFGCAQDLIANETALQAFAKVVYDILADF